jgi:hypothetical protein
MIMSVKTLDQKGRWRNKTVAFRMSPEEAVQLDIYSKLSGLTKQDYLIRRVFGKEVTVNGNPRVFKALRNQLASVLVELHRLGAVSADNDELLDTIQYIAEIMNGLKEEQNDQ